MPKNTQKFSKKSAFTTYECACGKTFKKKGGCRKKSNRYSKKQNKKKNRTEKLAQEQYRRHLKYCAVGRAKEHFDARAGTGGYVGYTEIFEDTKGERDYTESRYKENVERFASIRDKKTGKITREEADFVWEHLGTYYQGAELDTETVGSENTFDHFNAVCNIALAGRTCWSQFKSLIKSGKIAEDEISEYAVATHVIVPTGVVVNSKDYGDAGDKQCAVIYHDRVDFRNMTRDISYCVDTDGGWMNQKHLKETYYDPHITTEHKHKGKKLTPAEQEKANDDFSENCKIFRTTRKAELDRLYARLKELKEQKDGLIKCAMLLKQEGLLRDGGLLDSVAL